VRRPVPASPTAATANPVLMMSCSTHSRIIMPAANTGRDSAARYSAMRGPTAAWRAMAQGGIYQEAVRSSRLGSPSDPEPDSIDQAPAAMVTGTNCWLAQTHISGELQNQPSRGVLSQPICSKPVGWFRARTNSLTYAEVSGPQLRSRCRCRSPCSSQQHLLRPRPRRLRVSECRRAAP